MAKFVFVHFRELDIHWLSWDAEVMQMDDKGSRGLGYYSYEFTLDFDTDQQTVAR